MANQTLSRAHTHLKSFFTLDYQLGTPPDFTAEHEQVANENRSRAHTNHAFTTSEPKPQSLNPKRGHVLTPTTPLQPLRGAPQSQLQHESHGQVS